MSENEFLIKALLRTLSVAHTEGLILEPVYTSKAMAGLIDLIQAGRFSREDTVVFLHTGGLPALYAYNDHFSR